MTRSALPVPAAAGHRHRWHPVRRTSPAFRPAVCLISGLLPRWPV